MPNLHSGDLVNKNIEKDLWKADSSCAPMGIKREYVRIAGDLATGSLRSQIIYWYRPAAATGKSKLRVLVNGELYIAKTSKEWMEECCLSEAQVKRALQVLKDKGLIETRLKKFNGITQNHLRLLQEHLLRELQLLSTVQKELNESGEKLLSGSVLITSSDSAESDEPITKITTETTAESILCAGSATSATAGEKTLENNDQENKSVKKLIKSWKELIDEFHGGLMKPWSSKQWGQYKQLCNQLGPDCELILNETLTNWSLFAWEARHSAGLSAAPQSPDVGFFLKYAYLAKHLWTAKQQKLQASKPNSMPFKGYPKAVVLEEEHKPYTPSAEEIAALLATL